MQWLVANFKSVLTCLLVASEAAAAIVQLLFPNNKGVSGVIAGLIKIWQTLGAQEPVPPQS